MDYLKPNPHAVYQAGPLEIALRLANPGFEHCDRLTFRNGPRFAVSAAGWRDGWFVPTLLPVFLQTLDLAHNGHLREILETEARLVAAHPGPLTDAAIAQGRRLIDATGDPRGERVLCKLHAAVREHRMHGHFTVLFAARCAVFSIPVRTAVGAYLLQEMLAGAPETPAHLATAFVAECLDSLQLAGPRLRAA